MAVPEQVPIYQHGIAAVDGVGETASPQFNL